MHSIALVCEAEADARTVRKIAERLLLESPCREWINEENLSDFISWRGFHETDSYLDWKGSRGVWIRHDPGNQGADEVAASSGCDDIVVRFGQ